MRILANLIPPPMQWHRHVAVNDIKYIICIRARASYVCQGDGAAVRRRNTRAAELFIIETGVLRIAILNCKKYQT